jgi:hypothetical protein
MAELLLGLVVGAGIGYGIRAYISYRRRHARHRPGIA